MARFTNGLVQVSVGRALFMTRAIQRIKILSIIAGRTLVRGRTSAVLARRVADITNSRIMEISFRAGGQTLSKIKLFKF